MPLQTAFAPYLPTLSINGAPRAGEFGLIRSLMRAALLKSFAQRERMRHSEAETAHARDDQLDGAEPAAHPARTG